LSSRFDDIQIGLHRELAFAPSLIAAPRYRPFEDDRAMISAPIEDFLPNLRLRTEPVDDGAFHYVERATGHVVRQNWHLCSFAQSQGSCEGNVSETHEHKDDFREV